MRKWSMRIIATLICVGVIGILILLLSRSVTKLAGLPPEPILFDVVTIDTADGELRALTNDGNTYVPYGRLSGMILNSRFGECLGYVDGDKSDLVYELNGESRDTWLIERVRTGFLEQPIVYLNFDHSSVDAPDGISPLDYSIWR